VSYWRNSRSRSRRGRVATRGRWEPPLAIHMFEYILVHMKQMLIELDDELAAQLRRAVPARSRGRSEFVRQAIRKALWAQEEARTAAAYASQPDSPDEAYIDAAVWESAPAKNSRKKNGKP
jgi:Arc/MetJ-type ribon-helix-helix transcriptional regulator